MIRQWGSRLFSHNVAIVDMKLIAANWLIMLVAALITLNFIFSSFSQLTLWIFQMRNSESISLSRIGRFHFYSLSLKVLWRKVIKTLVERKKPRRASRRRGINYSWWCCRCGEKVLRMQNAQWLINRAAEIIYYARVGCGDEYLHCWCTELQRLEN